jgi:hypothetical protein
MLEQCLKYSIKQATNNYDSLGPCHLISSMLFFDWFGSDGFFYG